MLRCGLLAFRQEESFVASPRLERIRLDAPPQTFMVKALAMRVDAVNVRDFDLIDVAPIAGSIGATRRGVIGLLTSRRMIVCIGGSIITIGLALSSNIPIDFGSGVRPLAEENVSVSRTAANTSANRDRTQKAPYSSWSTRCTGSLSRNHA